jgi:nucleotide-binding universal stress UspA family protein
MNVLTLAVDRLCRHGDSHAECAGPSSAAEEILFSGRSHRRVLVVLDPRDAPEAVIEHVLARAPKATLVVLQVLPEWYMRTLAEAIRARLAHVAARFRAAGASITVDVPRGDLVTEVGRATRGHHADVIAMTTPHRGRDIVNRWLDSSLRDAVSREARVPVITVPMPAEDERSARRSQNRTITSIAGTNWNRLVWSLYGRASGE